MPSHDLKPDAWTLINHPYGVRDRMVQVTAGEVLLSFGVPAAARNAFRASSVEKQLIPVPAETAVYARSIGPSATVTTGSFSAGSIQQITSLAIILANANTTPATAGGWRVNDAGGGVLSLDSTMRRRAGIDVTKVDGTGTAGAVFKSIRVKTAVLTTFKGAIGVWVWTPINSAGGLNLVLRWSSDAPAADPPTATATNYYELQFLNEGQMRGQWSFLSVSGPTGKIFGPSTPNGTTVTVVGSPLASEVRQIEIVESWNAATPTNERYWYIDNAEANGKTKPMVVIGFDGFGDSDVSIANKIAKFDQYNMQGYIAGDGDAASTNRAKLQLLYDRGWDVISQGMNHTNYGVDSSTLSADFDAAVAILTGLGLTRSLDLFAYPFNSWSLASDAILAAKGVRQARVILGNQRIPYNTTGTINLRTTGSANIDNRTAAQVLAWVDEAIASGSHIFLYGHSVTSGAGSSTNMNLTEFNAMMDGIAALAALGQIIVVTPSTFASRTLLTP